MSDTYPFDISQTIGSIVLAVAGFAFHILNEMAAYSKPEMRKWFAEQRRSIVMWLAVVPSRNTRKKHKTIALGLIATAVFALGPLGYEMLEGHPCGAWGWWIVALICAAYSFWQLTPIARWRRIVVIAVGVLCLWILWAAVDLFGDGTQFLLCESGRVLTRGRT
jgi:hypothetical protein